MTSILPAMSPTIQELVKLSLISYLLSDRSNPGPGNETEEVCL